MAERHFFRQFLLFAAVMLLPLFTLWYVASGALAIPAVGLVNILLSNSFPELVHAVIANGGEAVLLTQFGEQNGQAIPLDAADYRLAFQLDTRILSYSLPFYSVLHFATQKKHYLGDWINGLIVLYTLFIAGLVCLCLMDLSRQLPDAFNAQAWTPDTNVLGIAYQFSVLIIPTLGPVAVWLWQSRDTPLLRELLRSLDKFDSEAN